MLFGGAIFDPCVYATMNDHVYTVVTSLDFIMSIYTGITVQIVSAM